MRGWAKWLTALKIAGTTFLGRVDEFEVFPTKSVGYRKTYFSLNASKNNWLLLIRQHALVLFLGHVSTILFIYALHVRGLLATVDRQIFASLFFLSLNFFALSAYVVPSGTSLGSADEVGEILGAKTPTRHLFKSRIATFFGIIFATTLLPQVAPYIGEIPLRLLNIGGGVERLFHLYAITGVQPV